MSLSKTKSTPPVASPVPVVVADTTNTCGENPLWHPQEKKLYWLDIPAGKLFRYGPATNSHEVAFVHNEAIGGFTFQADGSLLLFMARGHIAVWRDGKIIKTVLAEIPDERTTRFNDVIADPQGRVFCGTMATKERLGRLYRLDRDGRLTLLLEGIGCSNGMGFTADLKTLYYTDSGAYKVYRFDYDQSTGAITNQRVFVELTKETGLPDGMTVDANGDVWTAVWEGSCVIRFDPHGRELQRFKLPSNRITSVIFAGENLADLYVTSAGGEDRAANGVSAGALFRLNTGARGVPEFVSRIGL
jgi:D-xylono/L-arabinono-1,4-lactonase